jgi:hypothetical protein
MNSFFNYRINVHLTLCDNINLDKLIKSIKTLNKINKIFKLEKCNTSNPNDNQIYIFIEHGILICNFSHLHYDGYSIYLILNKIDQIYKDEIKNYKFNIYTSKFNLITFCYNNIKLLTKINYKNACNFFVRKNKKIIKITKTKFKDFSSKEIIHHVVDKEGVREYCLLLNARKIHNEYENVLGNLVYFSKVINKDQDIRSVLKYDEKINLEKKLNSTVPNALLINSYLNFVLPSYVRHLSTSSMIGNCMIISPINNDEKYIVIDYYH